MHPSKKINLGKTYKHVAGFKQRLPDLSMNCVFKLLGPQPEKSSLILILDPELHGV